MLFDLADLSLFRHVVEAGSITHGAERANLALASASTRIRNMEAALGAPLLPRRRPRRRKLGRSARPPPAAAPPPGYRADAGRPHAVAARASDSAPGRAPARG